MKKGITYVIGLDIGVFNEFIFVLTMQFHYIRLGFFAQRE